MVTDRVLIAVDDEAFGLTMVNFLVKHDWPEGTRFIVLHVIDLRDAVVKWPSDQIEMEANSLVKQIADRLRDALPGVRVDEVVLVGRPKEVILDLAAQRKAGIIVMGAHGRHGISRFAIGSVSQAVASHALCSVAVVRVAPTKTPTVNHKIDWRGTDAEDQILRTKWQAPMKVLVPVEDCEFGQTLVNFLSHHGFPDGTTFRVLHVQPWVPSESEQLACPALMDFVEDQYAEARELVSRTARKIERALPRTFVEAEISEGQPSARIIATAGDWGADAIIMGSHGRTNFQQFFLGSISATVLAHSECSVVILRPVQEDLDLESGEFATKSVVTR